MKTMKTVIVEGFEFQLPYRGRMGKQIYSTLVNIIRSKKGIALYAAMDLRGRAKNYSDVYERSFIRFAEANQDLLEEGYVGPKGGWGCRFVGIKGN